MNASGKIKTRFHRLAIHLQLAHLLIFQLDDIRAGLYLTLSMSTERTLRILCLFTELKSAKT